MADSKKYDGSVWNHSLRKLTTATESVGNLIYSNGQSLLDWRITGNTLQDPVEVNGVGVRTENLLSYHYLFTPDYDRHSTYFDYYKLMLEPSTQYTFTTNATSTSDATTFLVGTANVMGTSNDGLFNGVAKTITSNPDGSIYIARRIAKLSSLPILPESDFDNGVYYIMLNTGSTAIPYEPYSYKIPVTCGGVTTDIYIGESPLYDGDTISMTDTGIVIPTIQGANSITVDTTVQPSEFTATWTGWHNANVKEWDGQNWT